MRAALGVGKGGLGHRGRRGLRKLGQTAIMGGLDVLVFTAGIGEGDIKMRARIVNKLNYMGAKIDPERNDVMAKERLISTDDSKVKVMLVPTNEELMIARDTVRVAQLD